MGSTQAARQIADRLVTSEWQNTSALWAQARGAATWGTFCQALRDMVAEGTAERRQADKAKAVFYRRVDAPEGGKVSRGPTEEEFWVLGLLSAEPITAMEVFDLVRKRDLPIRTVGWVRVCLKTALYFDWVSKHGPKPNRYAITRKGEAELDEVTP